MQRVWLALGGLFLAIFMFNCSRNTANLEQELKTAIEQRRAAFEHGDVDGYANRVADDLVLIDDDGSVRTKASVLQQIRAEGSRPSAPISDLRVQVNDEIGIATYHVDRTEPFGSQLIKSESRQLETYKRQSDRWVLVSRAIVPIPYPNRIPAIVDPSIYDSYSGVYDFGNNFLITVKRDADNLTFIVSEDKDKIPQRLLPFSDVSFYEDKTTGVLTFIRNAKGKVVRLEVWDGNSTVQGRRIEER